MWRHVKLSEQIRPRDTLACCCDTKQLTNKQTISSHDSSYDAIYFYNKFSRSADVVYLCQICCYSCFVFTYSGPVWECKTPVVESPRAGIARWLCVGLAVLLDAVSWIRYSSEENFSGGGDFTPVINIGSDSIPLKPLSDESINRGLVCSHTHPIVRTQTIRTIMP